MRAETVPRASCTICEAQGQMKMQDSYFKNEAFRVDKSSSLNQGVPCHWHWRDRPHKKTAPARPQTCSCPLPEPLGSSLMGDQVPKCSEAEAHLQEGSRPWPLVHEMICPQVYQPHLT